MSVQTLFPNPIASDDLANAVSDDILYEKTPSQW